MTSLYQIYGGELKAFVYDKGNGYMSAPAAGIPDAEIKP